MKKKKVLIIAMISVLLILSIVGISYALWTLNLTQTGENDIASTCFNISFTEKDNISLQKSYPLYDADGKKLTPYEFTITNNCDSYASYAVNLEVLNTTTLTNNEAIKVMFSKKEDNVESKLKLDLLSNYETVTKTLNNATSAFKLVTEYLGPNKSKTYDLRLWLDENVTTETVNIQNTTFNSKVVVTANYVNMGEIPFATKVIANLAKDADSSSTDVYTVPDKTSDTCTYTLAYDGTSDNNLRYVGANPCNYVKVDDEYWRIIGVMNNIDDGTGKKESRLKLIRDESIGEYSWDTSDSSVNNGKGINEWSQADLMKLLNPGYENEIIGGSLYYNAESGTCFYGTRDSKVSCDFTSTGLKNNLKNLIGNTLWNIGTNGKNDYTTATANQFYSFERSNNTGDMCSYGKYCNDSLKRTTTWQGKIGLIYPSDYGFATSGGSTSNRTSCINEELYEWRNTTGSYKDCVNNDWIYLRGSQWTLTPRANSSNATYIFNIDGQGAIQSMGWYTETSSFDDVRPSVYILSEVMILIGEGTKENPYELSL